jgi:DNA invertase Pin-like site-specific DNA recombinase
MKPGHMARHYDDLRLMFEKGVSQEKIAVILGCSEYSVFKAEKRLGLKRDRVKVKITEKDLKKYISKGWTYEKIAKKYKTSKQTIYRNAKKYGITIYKKHEQLIEESKYQKILSMKW